MEQGATLFRRWLDGDESAINDIFILYHRPLILFINRYVRDLNMAEELAADTLAQLVVSPKKYNFSVSLKTYLFMIGKSRALDYLRHQKRRRETELPLPESQCPEDQLIKEEEKRALYDAISSLNEEYRTVIHLVYFEELSHKEAAKVMHKSTKQVDNLVFRARQSLKEILSGMERKVNS